MSRLRGVARQLGVGRALYRLRKAQREGFVYTLRMWRANGSLERAARELRQFPGPEIPVNATVVWLTGAQHWHQTAFCLYSLGQALGGTPDRVAILSDGTLESRHADALLAIAPKAHIFRKEELDALSESHLRTIGAGDLFDLRNRYIHIRKLLDVSAALNGPTLLLDSDMLFHHRPDELIDWLQEPASPLYMHDRRDNYGCSVEDMEQLCGATIPPSVNSGVIAIDRASIDWLWFVGVIRGLIALRGVNFYTEQCLYAMLMARLGGTALPRERYIVRPEGQELEECSAPLHHYTWTSRLPYLESRWRPFAAKP